MGTGNKKFDYKVYRDKFRSVQCVNDSGVAIALKP